MPSGTAAHRPARSTSRSSPAAAGAGTPSLRRPGPPRSPDPARASQAATARRPTQGRHRRGPRTTPAQPPACPGPATPGFRGARRPRLAARSGPGRAARRRSSVPRAAAEPLRRRRAPHPRRLTRPCPRPQAAGLVREPAPPASRSRCSGTRRGPAGNVPGQGVAAAEGRPQTAKGCPLDRAAPLLPDAVRPTRQKTRASRRRHNA